MSALYHSVVRGQGGGTAMYKNSKYLARVKMDNGKYRYIYNSAELAAYKNGSGGGNKSANKDSVGIYNETLSKKSKKSRGAYTPSGRVPGLSSGALNYSGITESAGPTNPNEPVKKKSKKKKKVSIINQIIKTRR